MNLNMSQSMEKKRKLSIVAVTVAVGILAVETIEEDDKERPLKLKKFELPYMKNQPKFKSTMQRLEKRICINDNRVLPTLLFTGFRGIISCSLSKDSAERSVRLAGIIEAF